MNIQELIEELTDKLKDGIPSETPIRIRQYTGAGSSTGLDFVDLIEDKSGNGNSFIRLG